MESKNSYHPKNPSSRFSKRIFDLPGESKDRGKQTERIRAEWEKLLKNPSPNILVNKDHNRKIQGTEGQDTNLEPKDGTGTLDEVAEQAQSRRPPLERNLSITDFPSAPLIPTIEEVYEDLREVTFKYTNCRDPKKVVPENRE